MLKCPKCGNKKDFLADATVNVHVEVQEDGNVSVYNGSCNDYDISGSWIYCNNEDCEFGEEISKFME